MSPLDTVLPPAAAGSIVDADNPWPGLLPFGEADQAYFQGRRTEARELFRLAMRERLTILFGVSGLGKSSLLNAGLFPLLRGEDVLPVYIRLDYSSDKPDLPAQVVSAIAREAAATRTEMPAARAGETLWEFFHREGQHFWNLRNRPLTPLLVFDQFEEIFTLGRTGAGRIEAAEVFLEQLADLAAGRPPAALKTTLDARPDRTAEFDFDRHDYKLLLSLREDYLAHLESLRARIPALAFNRMRLLPMRGEAALQVVNQAGHLIDPDVAAQVVRFAAADRRGLDLADQELEPFLLSLVCRELNNRRRAIGEPKITASLLEGSQDQLLANFYRDCVEGLPAAIGVFIEDQLLTDSGNNRNIVALEDALNLEGVTREAINTLVNRRLVRIEDRGGVQWLELTHDRLTGVVKESREARRQTETAERERTRCLVAEERERAAVAQLRRSRRMAIAFLVLALVASAATVWAFWARAEATRQRVAAQVSERNANDARRSAEAAKDVAESARKAADEAARRETKANLTVQDRNRELQQSTAELQKSIHELTDRDKSIETLRSSMSSLARSQGRDETLKILTDLSGSSDQIVRRVAAAVKFEIAPPAPSQSTIVSRPLAADRQVPPPKVANSIIDLWNHFGGGIVEMSHELQVDPSVIIAFIVVESGGIIHNNKRMWITFEPRIFLRNVRSANPSAYAKALELFPGADSGIARRFRPVPGQPEKRLDTQDAQWEALAAARLIDANAALLSTGMGTFSVMGQNFKQVGFQSVQEMFQAFQADERYQLAAVSNYLRDSRMLVALQSRNFEDFARRYNGIVRNGYPERLAAAAKQAEAILAPLGLR